VLDLLSDQQEFTDQQVRDQVMTLLLAGHETTAMALSWALAAIDQAPAVREELEAEWDAWAEGQPTDKPPPTLPSATLPLTTAVLAETLRLWPPSGRAHCASRNDVPDQSGAVTSRPSVVGRARPILAATLAAPRARAARPL
jgi:cytochrome P450